MGKIPKLKQLLLEKTLGRASFVGSLIMLVIVAVFAYWLYLQFQSGATITLFGFAVPAWMIYGLAGAIVIAIVAKFIRQAPLLLPVGMRLRGAAGGFVALIMLFLAMIIVLAYVLNFFGLSWSTVLSYSALALAILVIIVLKGGRGRGMSAVTVAIVLLAIAAVGAAVYYAHWAGNVTYAIYASVAAVAIVAIAVFLHRHKGRSEEVVVLEQ